MTDIAVRIAKLEGAIRSVSVAMERQCRAQVVSIWLSTAFIGLLGAIGVAIQVCIVERIDALPAVLGLVLQP